MIADDSRFSMLTTENLCTFAEHGSGARPLFFHTGDGMPWGFGSCVLVKYAGRTYVITARHVIENQGAKMSSVCVAGSGTITIPLLRTYRIAFDGYDKDDEEHDFLLIEVDEQRHMKIAGKQPVAWDLERRSFSASRLHVGSELLVVGFPFTEFRYDWDQKVITDLMLVRLGLLSEQKLSKGVYKMSGAPSSESFDGLSGAPIYSLINGKPLLSGLAIRGSGSSGCLYFIDVAYLVKGASILV